MGAVERATLLFFAYCVAAALLVPRLERAKRLSALWFAAAGILLASVSARVSDVPVLHDWIIPPLVLLSAYWGTGCLFAGPMPRLERVLLNADNALRVRWLAARCPRALAELLEIAYLAVYPVVPAALVLRVLTLERPNVDAFWGVVLVTDYICFGFLPWVQTRPPRVLEKGTPWPSSVRRLNLWLLGTASIQVNTFPSGHAAEALAVALLLSAAPWPVFAAMLLVAAAIAAGAVYGRYHYATDAIAGFAVAAAVWTWW
jgi:membrane-associated phospholipid phosphatase